MRPILFLLLFPFSIHAQEIISGKIVEEKTGKPIPYATIGLVQQNTGTNADEKGEFSIGCKQVDKDSFVVSCVGYMTIKMSVRDFKINPIFTLVVNTKRLKPVVIKNKWTIIEVGNSKKSLAYGVTTTGYQSQAATKLVAPCAKTVLQSLHIRTSKYGGEGVFQVHVFDIDSISKGPGEELTDTIIQVSSKPGIATIDMTPYQIVIPGKDFFVSVEWLRIPFNAKPSSSKYEDKAVEEFHYSPHFCFTKEPHPVDEIWGLAYSGKWYLETNKNYYPNSLAISATVKY